MSRLRFYDVDSFGICNLEFSAYFFTTKYVQKASFFFNIIDELKNIIWTSQNYEIIIGESMCQHWYIAKISGVSVKTKSKKGML